LSFDRNKMKKNRISALTRRCFAALLTLSLALVFFISCNPGRKQNEKGDGSIPFEVFTKFERVDPGSPLISLPPPEWAAAAYNHRRFAGGWISVG